MPDIALQLGPSLTPLAGGVALWALLALLFTAAALFGRRIPAPLLWLGPASVVIGGVAGSLLILSEAPADSAAGTAAMAQADALLALRRALTPAALGYATAAAGLIAAAPLLALTNVVRGGEQARWTLAHALAASPAALAAPAAAWASLSAGAVAALGAASLALASLRLGGGHQGRRMAAARGLVASHGVAAALCVVVALALEHRRAELAAWAHLVDPSRPAASTPSPPDAALLAAIGVAGVLVLCATLALVPVARLVMDGRTSAGFITSLLLVATTAVITVPVLDAAADATRPDPAGDRVRALQRAGIRLPIAPGAVPWRPALPVTVGLYWVSVDDARVVPIQDGVPALTSHGDDLTQAMSVLAPPQQFQLELDDRVDAARLLPVLRALHAAGHRQLCVTVQERGGKLGCLPATLGDATEAPEQLIVAPDELTHVRDEVQPIGRDRLAERLTGPTGVHPAPTVRADELVDVLAAGVPQPILVVGAP